MSLPGIKPFYRLKRFWISLVILVGIVAAIHRPVLSKSAAFMGKVICGRQGLEFRANSVSAGLFSPLVMEGVSLRFLEREGDCRSGLEIESLVLEWQSFGGMFSNPTRLVRSASMNGLHLLADLRRGEGGNTPARAWQPMSLLAVLISPAGGWPEKIDIENSTVEFSGENTRAVLGGVDLSLGEQEQGAFAVESLVIHTPHYQRVFGPLTARTAWDGRRFSLVGMEFVPGVMVSEISCELPRNGDPSVSFKGHVFGGTLRGDLFFQAGERGPFWDFAAVCSNVSLEGIPNLLGLEGRAMGSLAEGRFTYRGEPSRPTDAEASLRVLAKDFRWNERGWESLEIGASLIHRRLLISNFDLKQKENSVALNGEISLAEGWSKITESPFLLNLRANIQELGSLAGLTGSAVEEIQGELQADGSLSGRPGSLDGFVGVKAKGVEYRGASLDEVDLEVLFQKKNAEIVKCELKSSRDRLVASGRIGISAPHRYIAKMEAGLNDIAAWLRPFPKLGGGIVSGGALKLQWNGEGSVDGHSGGFDLNLSKLVSTYTPGGLTGRFAGSYSPQNLYFSEALLENGAMRMQSRITLASTGVNFDDVQLKANGKTLLHGKAYLPLNPFTIPSHPDWTSAVMASEATYLEANTPDELALRDLVKLAGQNWPLEGFLKFQLEAVGPATEINGKLSAQAREVFWGKQPGSAPSDVRLTVESSAGAAKLQGEWINSAMSPVHFSAAFPFGLFIDGNGTPQWIKRDVPIEAMLNFPRAELALLRPVFKNLPGLSGELSGRLKIHGTLDAPSAAGSMEIRNAAFHPGSLASPAMCVNGRMEVENSTIQIKDIGGEIEPGRFELSGTCDFSDLSKPEWNLSWRGERIPLANDTRSTLLAEVDLQTETNADGGILRGEVRFVDSSIRQTIEVSPLLSATGAAGLDLMPHTRALHILAPLPETLLDIKVRCTDPIRFTGQKFTGTIIPNLRLEGTTENPVLVGQVVLEGLEFGVHGRAFFADRAVLGFFPDKPWEPFVLAEASGVSGGFAVSALAFGSLTEGKWVLRSAEPFPPQALWLLIRNGTPPFALAPDSMGPAEFFLVGDAESNGITHPVALRLDDQSLAGGGIRFQESMDFSLSGALLPMGSFEHGFEWKWTPVY